MKRYTQIVRPFWILFIILPLLPGCGPVLNPYEENFKCRAKDDTGECIDTPTAYQKARYPETEENVVPPNSDSAQRELQNSRYEIINDLLQEETKPLLQPPKIIRVLLLPYKGEDEELFMSRYVYLKIEDSQWVLTDIEEP
jgi:conjugal transfer pilus assembly protein TraV